MDSKHVGGLVKQLYEIVDGLEALFPGRHFTPDGHMVGSIGECLVAEAYELELMPASNKGYDALSPSGAKVEIKSTQSNRVAFRSCPEPTIIIKLNRDGTFEEYFNGPGELIWETFAGLPKPSNGQYQIGLKKVQALSSQVRSEQQIKRNQG